MGFITCKTTILLIFLGGWKKTCVFFGVLASNICDLYSILGKMIQFDEHMFQMGWSNQLVLGGWKNKVPKQSTE